MRAVGVEEMIVWIAFESIDCSCQLIVWAW